MSDGTAQPPVDSRQPGFNPEVEQSHAEASTAAAAAAKGGAASGDQAPAAPAYSHRCTMCGALYEKLVELCAACGSSEHIEALPSQKVT